MRIFRRNEEEDPHYTYEMFFPHDKHATDLLHNLMDNDSDLYSKRAEQLLQKRKLDFRVNDIEISFKLKRRYVFIKYKLPSGRVVDSKRLYDSIRCNNDPHGELLLAIAQAEANAMAINNPEDLVLHNYPAMGFYVSSETANTFKFKMRQKMRHHLMRFWRN